MSEPFAATLYIVATPIGNLADMTLRAIETLQSVDLIAAEDTRHSKYLLQHYNIDTTSISLHQHNEQQRSEALIKRLQNGESVALISDAGTPLISDPGYRFVVQARAAGITVVPIPGSCALITALSASGLASDRFAFEGFLPAKSVARSQRLTELVNETRTLIFYESPKRLTDTLLALTAIFGETRRACLARELTKIHETIETRPLGELTLWVQQDTNQQKGEVVLLVEGCEKQVSVEEAEIKRVLAILLAELPVKKAAALTASLLNVAKNDAYKLALKLQQK